MKINRPLSPHLSIYKPQLTSTLSIFHRISGGFLAVSVLLAVFFLTFVDLHLNFYHVYFYLFFFFVQAEWFVFAIINLIALAFCYHLSNGLRHLFWDFGFFLDLSKVYATGSFTITLTLVLFSIFIILRNFFF